MYITLGALTIVWSGIWYAWLRHAPPHDEFTFYWCYGFMLTGLTLLAIGLAIGRIGRAARHAELPPKEVTPAVAQTDQKAAERAPMVAPVNPANAGVGGTVPRAVLATPITRQSPPR